MPGRIEELRDRSVLLATGGQLPTAVALLELDGVARRLVLCTPELDPEHIAFVATAAAADALVVDAAAGHAAPPNLPRYVLEPRPAQCDRRRAGGVNTEWVLLTSGTTGQPKLVSHRLAGLTAALPRRPSDPLPVVWSTFYDIRRYGGLQIYLRAVLGGAPLVFSDPAEAIPEFLERAGRAGVTHVSGTPSHWRRVLMSSRPDVFAPRYLRLSGEVADQAVLDGLRAAFPNARISHAFASTEAGVAFDVIDGRAGFPATFIDGTTAEKPPGVELDVVDDTLRVRSAGVAGGYLGVSAPPFPAENGFVDTGDLVERVADRYHFRGRRGGVINVGGQKVYPEEVEAVLNADPRVRMSLVRARRNPITGAVVVAEIVLAEEGARALDPQFHAATTGDLLLACRRTLPAHKVPAVLRVVPALPLTTGGKLVRAHA